jgi:folate-dependent phosphoribosylglycinamide formyltransferase PurN
MKILIVTSEVTFVPDNYGQFLENLFIDISSEKEITVTLAVLKNNSFLLILKGLYLFFSGAKLTGWHLIRNSFLGLFKKQKIIAFNYGINLHYFKNPNSKEFIKFASDFETDLLINARTRYIYKNKILKIPKIGALNIHHGLLPEYRGVMCDLWAMNDKRPTGFTIHKMDKKIDNGDIVRRIVTGNNTANNSLNELQRNFSNLIYESSKIEGKEVAKLIKTIKNTRTIPIEIKNTSSKAIYSKNPTFSELRLMIKKGLQL